MSVINRPTPDPTLKDKLVGPQGGMMFLPIALKESSTGTVVVLDSDWNTVSPIAALTDPDSGAIAWNTNTLDPQGFADNGEADTYDENHPDYVGDQFTPEVPGLFAPVRSGGVPLRLALKIAIPAGAEQTSSNNTRSYQVSWLLRKHGNNVSAVELFEVGPPAIPVFSDISVTWAEVTALISSSVTDATQQEAILLDGTEEIRAAIEDCGIDPDSLPVGIGNRSIKRAIIKYLRGALLVLDSSSGLLPTEVKEGLDTFKGLRPSDAAIAKMQNDALATIERWCKRAKAGSFFAYGASGHAEDVF